MSRCARAVTVGLVGDQGHRDEGGLRGGSTLFLVELRTTSATSSDVDDMHRALHHAVSRLQSGGLAIGWACALLLPEEARCLCVIRASDKAHAVLARDTAGLSAARVQAVLELSGSCTGVTSRTSPDLR